MMIEISKYFLEYYSNLCKKNNRARKDDVVQGICAFVKEEIPFLPSTESEAVRIADSRLRRFTLMSLPTFEVFFRSYEKRSKIEKIKHDSELLALNRYKKGTLISEDCYSSFITDFQATLNPILYCKDYEEYISEINREVSLNLRYAAGIEKRIPEKIINRARFFDK